MKWDIQKPAVSENLLPELGDVFNLAGQQVPDLARLERERQAQRDGAADRRRVLAAGQVEMALK